MTRAVPNQFASLTSPSLPNLDADLLAVANLAVVACTATGTNAVVLTPITATVTVSAYSDKEIYSFNAPATSTGVMTVQVSSGAVLKLFKPGGTIQANTSDVVNTQFYLIAYQAALDTGAGGFVILNATNRQPTRTVLTSGTAATYTTPVGATRIDIRMVGGGGGGAGSGTAPGVGGNGTASTWSGGALSAGGGTGASANNGGGGGATVNGDVGIPGATGMQVASLATASGGVGGASPFGGAGTSGATSSGGGAQVNSGSGGGGAGANGTAAPGGGGGAGGYIEKRITVPAATYTYTVGAAGIAGIGGGSGAPGGAGAAGLIIVDEFYN